MGGSRIGGLKAAQKNLEKDPEFYSKIGKRGGQNGHEKGFALNRKLAAQAGRKGGLISKRRPVEETNNEG